MPNLARKLDLGGAAPVAGQLSLHVIRGPARDRLATMPPQSTGDVLRRILRQGLPSTQIDLSPAALGRLVTPQEARRTRRQINRWRTGNLRYLTRGIGRVLAARALGIATFYGALDLTPIFKIGTPAERRLPLGLVGLRVVTNNGVFYIVDAFQNTVEPENMKYHGLGTGSTTEDATDAALVTELTTQYTGNVRATGNLTEGATGNIFHTEGTNTLDETPGAALREHGLFSAASAGVLFDRTVYAAITLSSGDGLLSKYEVTFAAGS